jgi:hypothetical protein
MASIFKPKYPIRKTVNGKRVVVRADDCKTIHIESMKWAIEYTDEDASTHLVAEAETE